MPIFMVERRFAEELEAAAEVIDGINRINDEEGVRWLYSFLSADRHKSLLPVRGVHSGRHPTGGSAGRSPGRRHRRGD